MKRKLMFYISLLLVVQIAWVSLAFPDAVLNSANGFFKAFAPLFAFSRLARADTYFTSLESLAGFLFGGHPVEFISKYGYAAYSAYAQTVEDLFNGTYGDWFSGSDNTDATWLPSDGFFDPFTGGFPGFEGIPTGEIIDQGKFVNFGGGEDEDEKDLGSEGTSTYTTTTEQGGGTQQIGSEGFVAGTIELPPAGGQGAPGSNTEAIQGVNTPLTAGQIITGLAGRDLAGEYFRNTTSERFTDLNKESSNKDQAYTANTSPEIAAILDDPKYGKVIIDRDIRSGATSLSTASTSSSGVVQNQGGGGGLGQDDPPGRPGPGGGK